MDQGNAAGPDALLPEGEPLKLTWAGPAGLLGLAFTNAFLRLLTLGIYNFWAKTEVRKRIWSAVRLNGEPLTYTGTGKELCLGFLIIFAAVVFPIMLLSAGVVFYFGPESTAASIFNVLIYGFIFLLTGFAIYRAQRYRLSRTSWRGIRGGLTGSDRAYAWAYSWSALLIPFTWGWVIPWRTTMLQTLMMRDTRFGDRPFQFRARPGPLYPSFAVFWIGTAVIAALAIGGFMGMSGFARQPIDVTEGGTSQALKIVATLYGILAVAYLFYYILSAWYRAQQINHFSNHTHFEGAKLKSTVTGAGLVKVAVGNFLLTMLGWGIGAGLFLLITSTTSNVLSGETESIAARLSIFAGVMVLIAFSGLFSPFVQARNARYLVENLSIDGDVPLARISQGADQGIKRGEGLAQAFDVDAF